MERILKRLAVDAARFLMIPHEIVLFDFLWTRGKVILEVRVTEVDISKKVELSAEERAQLALRMLSKEQPVADCGVRSRRCIGGAMSLSVRVSKRSTEPLRRNGC